MSYHLLAIIILAFLSSCGNSNQTSSNGEIGGDSIEQNQNSNTNPSTEIEFVKLDDPLENAFSVDMPKDWYTKIGLERPYGIVKSCGVAISPDQKTRIFFGDPSLPSFTLPVPDLGFYDGMSLGSPLQMVSSYVEPNLFFENYTKMAYAKKPSFKIISIQPDAELQKIYSEGARKAGLNARITVLATTFEYVEDNEKRIGVINGISTLGESMWFAEVNGFTTTEANKTEMQNCLANVVKSYKTNPQWREKENRAHEQRMQMNAQASANYMQQMTNAHNQRMANMQASFNAHQQRMGNLQAGYDAQNQTYRDNQASSDNNHRRNIDVIRGEETVRQGNKTAKVEAGYNNYYVNSSNNSYYGTNRDPQTVPDGYEKWNVER